MTDESSKAKTDRETGASKAQNGVAGGRGRRRDRGELGDRGGLEAEEPCELCGGTGVIDLDAEAAPDCYEHMGFVPCSCAGGRG